MAGAFLGTGWAFPIQADDTGGIRMRSREEDIREAIGVILGTRLGERVMRPEFGTALGDLVFDPNDANLAGRIEFLVRKALERWDPPIVLKDVRAPPARGRSFPPHSNSVNMFARAWSPTGPDAGLMA